MLGFAQKGILKAQWSQYKCFRKKSEQISYQSEKQEPSSDKRKADGRWDIYLWTAERTSFFFIFPPTLEAISNAPDLDIWQKQTNPLQDRWKWNQSDEIKMKLTDFNENDWENEEITVRCFWSLDGSNWKKHEGFFCDFIWIMELAEMTIWHWLFKCGVPAHWKSMDCRNLGFLFFQKILTSNSLGVWYCNIFVITVIRL